MAAPQPELRIVRRRTVDLDPELAALVSAPAAAPARRRWWWAAALALLVLIGQNSAVGKKASTSAHSSAETSGVFAVTNGLPSR